MSMDPRTFTDGSGRPYGEMSEVELLGEWERAQSRHPVTGEPIYPDRADDSERRRRLNELRRQLHLRTRPQ